MTLAPTIQLLSSTYNHGMFYGVAAGHIITLQLSNSQVPLIATALMWQRVTGLCRGRWGEPFANSSELPITMCEFVL